MTLYFTPFTLRRAYQFLDATKPFQGWNLPDADDVVFRVIKDRQLQGYHDFKRGRHIVGVSASVIGHTQSLILVMAHEMIHVHEQHTGLCKPGVEHSAAFKKLAQRVCAEHGFDPKLF